MTYDLKIYKYCLIECKNVILTKYNIKIEVISPFGFEVFEDLSFRDKNFNRFYIYAGCDTNTNLSHIESIISQEIISILRDRYPSFYSDLAVIALRSGDHFFVKNDSIFSSTDICIVVEARSLSDISLLEDYAKYILCTSEAILNRQLKEALTMHKYQESRARIYQLYLMICKIFDYDNSHIKAYLYQLISFNKEDNLKYYYSEKQLRKSTKLDNYVISQISKDLDQINNMNINEDLIQMSIKSYHGDNILNAKISKGVYNKSVNHIIQSYNEFWRFNI